MCRLWFHFWLMSANMVEDGEERVEEVKRTNSQQQSSFAGGPQKVVGQSVTWFDLLKHVLQMCNSNVEPKNGLKKLCGDAWTRNVWTWKPETPCLHRLFTGSGLLKAHCRGRCELCYRSPRPLLENLSIWCFECLIEASDWPVYYLNELQYRKKNLGKKWGNSKIMLKKREEEWLCPVLIYCQWKYSKTSRNSWNASPLSVMMLNMFLSFRDLLCAEIERFTGVLMLRHYVLLIA